ncbi:sulfatase [Kribbella sp. CA-294648]|uniref:sulfatase n=1 Tax=Kribbella sp. CA-294648 TaxID=3239948 RepID=UPI003D8DCAB6
MINRPNIVVILVDDLGWRDLGCYGSTFYETPRLDQLAREGLQFTDAYAAAPVCSPTRASIMSGKYPATVGVTQYIGGESVGALRDVPYLQSLPLNEYSLARALRSGGYRTWHIGKWHLGSNRTWPDKHGFDVNVAGCDWGRPPSYTSPYGCPTMHDGPSGEYLTDRLTDEAIQLIKASDDQPFFLNLWHYAVHTPIEAPAPLVHKYTAKAEALGLDEIEAVIDGEPLAPWHLNGEIMRRRVIQSDPHYAAMVENLDHNVGRLLDALQECGKADNTVVIFTSDNGGLATAEGSPTTNAPLSQGKGWMHDGGIRVPLLVRWPGHVAPARMTAEPVTSPDFYPTLLEVADLSPLPEQHVDGRSFRALLDDEPFQRGPIFWHYPHYSNQGGAPGAAVRDGASKLIRYFEDDHLELYHLDRDIEERIDLAAQEVDEVARLKQLLDSWMESVHAQVPKRNPYPSPWPALSRTNSSDHTAPRQSR